jgi:hypothetical protein
LDQSIIDSSPLKKKFWMFWVYSIRLHPAWKNVVWFLIFIPTPFAVIFPGCLLLDNSSSVSKFPEKACLIGVEKWQK